TNITSQSITVSADTLLNVAAGSSGYYFANTTKGTNSGWIKTNSWQDINLTCPTTYTYSVIYRNGDAVETASTTKTLTTSGCSGYTPPITTSAPIIIVSTTTVIVTSTLIVTTTISQAEPVKQAAAQQLQTQIADVKQQIIAWLTQLIQIIQEQIKQLQAQLQQLQAQ
ncbi:MAG: hypothetical protein NTZ42_01085, partial [Candidatus Gribaldobacteria bacterium]|nr:hypothetical protein [Candidatus Gribaldobacteria bacterium]